MNNLQTVVERIKELDEDIERHEKILKMLDGIRDKRDYKIKTKLITSLKFARDFNNGLLKRLMSPEVETDYMQ